MAIIREFSPSDRAAIEDCLYELQTVEHTLDSNRLNDRETLRRYLLHIQQVCVETEGAIFVAEESGGIAGFVSIWTRYPLGDMLDARQTVAYVSDIVVREQFRRRGLGSALLRRAEEHARSLGATVMKVEVMRDNQGARALYADFGFTENEIALLKDIGPK
jgi:ribosomal protein S18 acetylase RimI-like enzyme